MLCNDYELREKEFFALKLFGSNIKIRSSSIMVSV